MTGQPHWGAVAVMVDLETGKKKETCMYCYRPWHHMHYCGEPELRPRPLKRSGMIA